MDDFTFHIAGITQKISGLFLAILSAICSRMCSHAEFTRSQNRPFWTWALLFEGLSAIPCGLIAVGFAEYFSLGLYGTAAVASAAGWLGTRTLLELATRVLPYKK